MVAYMPAGPGLAVIQNSDAQPDPLDPFSSSLNLILSGIPGNPTFVSWSR